MDIAYWMIGNRGKSNRQPHPYQLPIFSKIVGIGLTVWIIRQALIAFHPLGINVHSFSSDDSIAVMMANDPIWDTYRLYFFGMDRIGLWSFLPQKLYSFLTHAYVDFNAVFTWQALFFLSGMIPAALLCRSFQIGVISYLFVAVGDHASSYVNFELCMGFSWQIPPLLWALWGVVGQLEDQKQNIFGPRSWMYLTAIYLGTFLSCWSSFASAPLLLGSSIVAAIFIGPKKTQWIHQGIGPTLGAMVGGIACERLINKIYTSKFHDVTNMGIEWNRLSKNFSKLWGAIHAATPFWLLLQLTFGLFVGAVILRGIAIWRNHSLKRTDPPRDAVRPFLGDADTQHLFQISQIIVSVGFINLLLTTLSSHVAAGSHDIRYSVPTTFFGFLGLSMLIVACIIRPIMRSLSHRIMVPQWARVLTLLWFLLPLWAMPAAGEHGESRQLLKTTQEAEDYLGKMPSINRPIPIVGTYWGAYPYVGLQTGLNFVPVPLEGETDRTRWYSELIPKAQHVLVSRYASSFPISPYAAFHGGIFRAVGPVKGSKTEDALLIHYTVASEMRPLPVEALRGFDFCNPGKVEFSLDPESPTTKLFLAVNRRSVTGRTKLSVVLNNQAASVEEALGGLIVNFPANVAKGSVLRLTVEALTDDKFKNSDRCGATAVYFMKT